MKTFDQPAIAVRDVASISFVIPAWNEEAALGATIDAIKNAIRQLRVTSEIIAVDDSSTDQTADIAVEHGARLVRARHRQIAATRNAGAKEARGDMLFFVDADTIVTEDVVRAAIKAVRQGAVGGGCQTRFDGRIPLYARCFEPVMEGISRLFRLAPGCFLFCTRDAFDRVHGFDRQLYAAEECAMSVALRREGKFVILRETVTTSGRKLRTSSAREIFTPLAWMALRGRRHLYDRKGLDIWYADRRPDHN